MATSAADFDSLHLPLEIAPAKQLTPVKPLVLLRKTTLSVFPLFRMRNLAHVFFILTHPISILWGFGSQSRMFLTIPICYKYLPMRIFS